MMSLNSNLHHPDKAKAAVTDPVDPFGWFWRGKITGKRLGQSGGESDQVGSYPKAESFG